MNTTAPQSFTAAAIARALGISKRAVLQALGGVPSVPLPVRGGEAKGWPLSALPPQWLVKLRTSAARQCFRDVEHLLSAAPQPWPPCARTGRVVTLAEISDHYRARAAALCSALMPALAAQHELDRAALIELARRHGYSKSEKQLFRDLERVTTRDRGSEEWTRLELYLEESSFRHPRTQATPTREAARYSHHELSEIVAALENKSEPTADDRAWLMHEAFNRYELLRAAQPDDERTIKATLTDYPLASLLIGGKYNGQHVPSLFLKSHDLHGLPRAGYWLERGV